MGKVELKIEIDADVLAEAQDVGLEIGALTEAMVRAELRRRRYRALSDDEQAKLWAEENAEAIQAQRKRIDDFGVFGEDLRTW